jgi:HD-GYP domain-containing protein (c-di-GMP phosphodiesterase class II)
MRAKPGMVLGRAVYNVRGEEVLVEGTRLTEENVGLLARAGCSEILVKDPRVSDIPVASLFSASLEARAVRSLHALIFSQQGAAGDIPETALTDLRATVHHMAELLFPPLGDPDLSSSASIQAYDYVHPVKTAEVAMLIGREMGFQLGDVVKLGTAAMLQNVGYLAIPPGILDGPGPLPEPAWVHLKKHPQHAVDLLSSSRLDPDVLRAVIEHHERWNGSGYPKGLKRDEAGLFARILAASDTYHALLSQRSHRPPFKPHEAMEFLVAFSGDLFDPEVTQVFARRVPQYPAGLGVKLSTGEVAIVSNPNLGHIARPIVRICSQDGRPVAKPFDVDLCKREHMDQIITEVLL